MGVHPLAVEEVHEYFLVSQVVDLLRILLIYLVGVSGPWAVGRQDYLVVLSHSHQQVSAEHPTLLGAGPGGWRETGFMVPFWGLADQWDTEVGVGSGGGGAVGCG